jgi:hypothetical protein
MAPLIIERHDQKGSTGRDNRVLVEGVLWTMEHEGYLVAHLRGYVR